MGVTVKKCRMIMSGNDCWNSVCFSCCRKVDNELADVMLSGRLFQNCAAATGNDQVKLGGQSVVYWPAWKICINLRLVLGLGLVRVSSRVRVRIRVKIGVSVMVRVSIRTSWVVNFTLFRHNFYRPVIYTRPNQGNSRKLDKSQILTVRDGNSFAKRVIITWNSLPDYCVVQICCYLQA